MGVTALNEIIRKCFEQSQVRKFNRIILDGTNLLVITITRCTSKLQEVFEFPDFWKQVVPSAPIMWQVCKIVTDTSDDILREIIGTFNKYALTEDDEPITDLYFVVDPSSPEYYIKRDAIDPEYLNTAFTTEELNILNDSTTDNPNTLIMLLKSAEQEKRREQKSNILSKVTGTIEWLHDNDKLSDVHYEKMNNIAKQCTFFKDTHNAMILMNVILTEVLKKLVEHSLSPHIHIVHATAEADLVIKNIAAETVLPTLVCSTDTDYNILFADLENAYVSSTFSSYASSVYHPFSQWRRFFGDVNDVYEYTIRLSPLLGNDYTVHQRMLDGKSETAIRDIRRLFNIGGSLHELQDAPRTSTVGRLYSHCLFNAKVETFTLKTLDNAIMRFDEKLKESRKPLYFSKYYTSIVIYRTWRQYDKKYERMVYDESDSEVILTNTLTKLLKEVAFTNDVNGKLRIFTFWDEDRLYGLSDDESADELWKDFFVSTRVREFSEDDGVKLLRYYTMTMNNYLQT